MRKAFSVAFQVSTFGTHLNVTDRCQRAQKGALSFFPFDFLAKQPLSQSILSAKVRNVDRYTSRFGSVCNFFAAEHVIGSVPTVRGVWVNPPRVPPCAPPLGTFLIPFCTLPNLAGIVQNSGPAPISRIRFAYLEIIRDFFIQPSSMPAELHGKAAKNIRENKRGLQVDRSMVTKFRELQADSRVELEHHPQHRVPSWSNGRKGSVPIPSMDHG